MTTPGSQPQAKHMLANDGMFCNNILAPSNPVYWLRIVTVHLFPFFLELRLALVKQTSIRQQQIVLDICWRQSSMCPMR